MNDHILSLIHFDVGFALLKLEQQVKGKQLRISLIRSNRRLFDSNELAKYLSEVLIQNTFLLEDIVKKSLQVIEMNNSDFIELERLETENSENVGFSTPIGEGGFFSTSTAFECITITNKELFYSTNSDNAYNDFFKLGNFKVFRSQDFAHECGRLLNLITAAYPDLKSKFKSLLSQYEMNSSIKKQDEIRRVTTFDKILRELDIIENIFKVQYQKYDATNLLPYPTILDNAGKDGIDGRYISSIDFYSDVELFNLQFYKSEFTQRFENANDNTLLKNQLLELKDKAISIRDYYNKNLTKENKIVADFLRIKVLPFTEQFEKAKEHRTCITISNYYIMEVYFGCERTNTNGFIRDWKFTHISDNKFLVTVCQNLIDFINKFNLNKQVGAGEIISLASIFNKNNNAFEVCKELLEDLELTIDGKPNTQPGKIGKLTGLITAIKSTSGMLKLDRPTDMLLLTYFNSFLNTNYKTFSKRNKDYAESLDVSNRFIKQNFRK